MNKLILEFFGTPGSGKTFISQKIALILKENGFEVSDRAINILKSPFSYRIGLKTLMVLKSLLLDTKTVASITPIILYHQHRNLIISIKLLYNWFFLIGLMRSELKNNDIVILDQGFGQAYWSTLFHGQGCPGIDLDIKLFDIILKSITCASLKIIHVQASESSVRRRLTERINGESPLDRDQSGNWVKAAEVLTKSRALLELVCTQNINLEIMEFDNDNKHKFKISLNKTINSTIAELKSF